ncbi:phage tail spike protein, partial [Pseudolactococcus reticulitermitis]
ITGTTTIDSGVITSAMIATAAITNAKIGDATISSAKISSLDAAKITTGTLSAARIASHSITADKIATNILTTITASAAIRITGSSIGYYDNGKLVTQIDSQGITIRRNETLVGTIGANNLSGHNEWRGLDFDLDYAAEYMTWAHKDTSNASTYTMKLTWYAKKLKNGMSKGFHFDDVVYFGDKVGVSYSDGTERHVKFTSTNISGQFETIQSGGGTAGIVFAGSNLYLCDDGVYVDFGIIREICKKLAGKSIALPTGFNSNGTATGWYNAQAFNNWTQYN